jgi:predicted nucleic acid-binding protein
VIYLDAGYIVKCYLREAGSAEVLKLVQKSAGRITALHGRAEFYSAVHRRLCEKHLSSCDAAAVWKQFEEDERSGLWHWLPVTESVVRRACNAFEKLDATVFLRASDAPISLAAWKISLRRFIAQTEYCWKLRRILVLKV